jgi:hypothetical protein
MNGMTATAPNLGNSVDVLSAPEVGRIKKKVQPWIE